MWRPRRPGSGRSQIPTPPSPSSFKLQMESMKMMVTVKTHNTHTHIVNLKPAASVTVNAVPFRSAADYRGGSRLPEAGIPPHPQRQGPVWGGQGRGGVLDSRHLSRDVQALTVSSEPVRRVHDKICQTTKIKVSSNRRTLSLAEMLASCYQHCCYFKIKYKLR